MKLSLKRWHSLPIAICGVASLNLFLPVVKADDVHPQSLQPQYIAQTPPADPSSVNGKIDSSSEKTEDGVYFNVHAIEGKAGDQITIEATSNEFDPFLLLIDSAGNLIAKDDNGGGGSNSKIVVTLPKDGTYGVGIFCLPAGKTGSYTLSMK